MSVATKVAMPFEVAKTLLAGCDAIHSERDPWSGGRTVHWFPKGKVPTVKPDQEEYYADMVANGSSYGSCYIYVMETDEYVKTEFRGLTPSDQAWELIFVSEWEWLH